MTGVKTCPLPMFAEALLANQIRVWGTLLLGTQYADSARKQRFREGQYALLSGSVTWTDPSDHYYVRVWGSNLTDHKYRLHYSGTGGGTYSPMAEPLMFGATVGFK